MRKKRNTTRPRRARAPKVAPTMTGVRFAFLVGAPDGVVVSCTGSTVVSVELGCTVSGLVSIEENEIGLEEVDGVNADEDVRLRDVAELEVPETPTVELVPGAVATEVGVVISRVIALRRYTTVELTEWGIFRSMLM